MGLHSGRALLCGLYPRAHPPSHPFLPEFRHVSLPTPPVSSCPTKPQCAATRFSLAYILSPAPVPVILCHLPSLFISVCISISTCYACLPISLASSLTPFPSFPPSVTWLLSTDFSLIVPLSQLAMMSSSCS